MRFVYISSLRGISFFFFYFQGVLKNKKIIFTFLQFVLGIFKICLIIFLGSAKRKVLYFVIFQILKVTPLNILLFLYILKLLKPQTCLINFFSNYKILSALHFLGNRALNHL